VRAPLSALMAFTVSGVVSLLLTPMVRRLALAQGWIDKPDARKIHKGTSTPRLGGLAILAGFGTAAVFCSLVLPECPFSEYREQLVWFAVGLGIICLTGMIDDIRGLSAFVKLGGQLAAACAVTFGGGLRIAELSNPFGGVLNLHPLAIPLTLLWIVGITNAINLLDGLDGLAAGVAAIVLTTIAVGSMRQGTPSVGIAVIAAAMAGGAVGFLPYNYHPASIFMGDTGSLSLGFALGTISTFGFAKATVGTALLVPVIAMAVPLIDTTLAIVRRAVQRKGLFRADKGHIHHRMLLRDPGGDQSRVVKRLYFLTASYSMIALAFTDPEMRGTVAFVAIVLTLLVSSMWIRQLCYTESDEEGEPAERNGPAQDLTEDGEE